MMIKTFGAVAIVTASLASPVFAQDNTVNTVPSRPAHALRHYRGSYNQAQDPAFVAPRAPVGGSYFDNEHRDPSRVGGYDADFNPPS
ncbi:MAG: hypothetical protein ABSG88_06150 [Bradyrhizobium sp.]